MLFSDLPPKAGFRAGFTNPSWDGQSRPVTEHRPPAWGHLWVLQIGQKLMTAFTFRSCWVPHVALGSVVNFALSELQTVPDVREGQQRNWRPEFKLRELVKQPLLRGQWGIA